MIFAGHFLTTIFEIEVDGKKTRAIPRDYQLDPVRDFPVHVDFLRLSKGQAIKVVVPVHVVGQEKSPGVKRGGTINIVEHSVELLVPSDSIPDAVEASVADLDIGSSIHIGDIKLPKGAKATSTENLTLVTVRGAVGHEGRRARSGGRGGSGSRRQGSCGEGLIVFKLRPRCPRPPSTLRPQGRGVSYECAPRCAFSSASAIPAPAMPGTVTISVSWRWTRSRAPTGPRPGGSASRPRRPRHRSAGEKVILLKPQTYMNESGRAVAEAQRFFKIPLGDVTVFYDELDLPPAKFRVKVGGGNAGHNGLRSITAHCGNEYRRVRLGIGHPGYKPLVQSYVLGRFRQVRGGLGRGPLPGARRQCRPPRRRARMRAFRTRSTSPWRREAGPDVKRPGEKADEQQGVRPWASRWASSVCRMSANPRFSTR